MLFVAVGVIVGMVVLLRNRVPSAPKRARRRRIADAEPISNQDKEVLARARTLQVSGQVREAASLLESHGLHRQAVDALESANYIDEACAILVRMGAHHRAGAVYARHNQWERAFKSYSAANMMIEAAQAATRAGRFREGAQIYEKEGRNGEAAACFVEAGEYAKAARLYAASRQWDKAIDLYARLGQHPDKLSQLQLEREIVDKIIEHLLDKQFLPPLARIVGTANKLPDLVLALLGRGKVEEAITSFSLSPQDLSPAIMSHISVDGVASKVAQMFLQLGRWSNAGMVLERSSDFGRAAEAFVKGSEFERAAYCFDRAGRQKEAGAMRAKAADLSQYPETISSSSPSQFDAPVGSGGGATSGPRSNASGHRVPPAPQNVNRDIAAAAIGDDLRAVFKRCPFMGDLDDDQKNKFWALGSTEQFNTGAIVLDYSSEPVGAYVLLTGHIRVLRRLPEGERQVDIMKPPEAIGELWLLADHPTSVRLVADGTVRVRIVERGAFNNLLDRDGNIARKIYKAMTLRLLKRLMHGRPNAAPSGSNADPQRRSGSAA